MCLSGCTAVLVAVLLKLAAASLQKVDGVQKCLDLNAVDCLEKMASDLLQSGVAPDKLELLPGISLIRTNRTARGIEDVANRTISFDLMDMAGQTGKDGRSKKKKKQRRAMWMMILMAAIAAKVSSIATASSILIPLGLKFITLLAAKAVVVGKIAIVLATSFGMLRLMSGQTEHSAEVIVGHEPHKKIDSAETFGPPPPFLFKKDFAQRVKVRPVFKRPQQPLIVAAHETHFTDSD